MLKSFIQRNISIFAVGLVLAAIFVALALAGNANTPVKTSTLKKITSKEVPNPQGGLSVLEKEALEKKIEEGLSESSQNQPQLTEEQIIEEELKKLTQAENPTQNIPSLTGDQIELSKIEGTFEYYRANPLELEKSTIIDTQTVTQTYPVVEIKYSDVAGFQPDTVTVYLGQRVKITNESDRAINLEESTKKYDEFKNGVKMLSGEALEVTMDSQNTVTLTEKEKYFQLSIRTKTARKF